MRELNLWGKVAATQPDDGALTKAGRAVWLKVCGLSRSQSECWAKAETIGRYVGLKLRTVQKWLGRFARWGWIETERRGPRSAIRRPSHRAPCASSGEVFGPRTTYLTDPVTKTKTMTHGACATRHQRQAVRAVGEEPPRGSPAPNRERCQSAPRANRGLDTSPGNSRRTPPTTARSTAGAPLTIPHLTPAQLRDPVFMHATLAQALPEMAYEPLVLSRWLGCSQRASRTGKSPGALFRWLWTERKWSWLSDDDEDRAQRDTKRLLYGQGPARQSYAERVLAEAMS